jgi:serine O-acetyltransferase
MKRVQSLSNQALAEYLARQLATFFPDQAQIAANEIEAFIRSSEERVYRCFAGIAKKYFNEGDRVLFNHLHTDQYAMYLSMLASHVYRSGGNRELATKLYYLNKALHGLDVYFDIHLPDIFLFVHPLSTVLGRATFADGLVVYQGCTVGCLNDGLFPTFTGPVILYAGASVLGRCRIGRNVCIAAGVSVINTDIPDDTVVLGSYPDYVLRPSSRPVIQRPPFIYGQP